MHTELYTVIVEHIVSWKLFKNLYMKQTIEIKKTILCTYFTECPTKVNVLAIVLGVVIGIVLVGLALLLIWKLVTTINDRRELARFEKETKDAKWDTVSWIHILIG